MNDSFGLILLVCCAVLLLGASGAGAQYQPVCSVKDFGAVGDGKADDTAALQAALDAAGKPSPQDPKTTVPSVVFLPRGTYRITQTLRLVGTAQVTKVMGEGVADSYGKPITLIKWDGAEGEPMWRIDGYLYLRLSEFKLDGGDKAGVLLRINSIKGIGTGMLYFERLNLRHGKVGMEFGADLDSCAGDMTFVDCNFGDFTEAAFRTMAPQNVDYVFIRCIVTTTPIGYHFYRGGNGTWIMPCFGRVYECFRIEAGGINCGVFNVTGIQIEQFRYGDEKKRVTIANVSSESNMSFTGIYTGCGQVWGEEADVETPNFILGPGAHVTVRDSMISGRVATLKGAANWATTWLQFDNCRFRCASDPRVDVTYDEFSGYELRNCTVQVDNITSRLPQRTEENVFVAHFVKYPTKFAVINQ